MAAGVSTPAIFAALTVLPGPAALMTATSGSAQTATVNSPFASPLVATVTDAFGNPVPGVTVAFASPTTGAGAIFPAGATATTGASGQAAIPVTAGASAGTFSVQATVAGVANAAKYVLTNLAVGVTLSSHLLAVGTGPGAASSVNVYDGATGALTASFFAFDPHFLGGVHVAVGDVNGDGVPDVIVAAGAGGGPHVKVVDGTKLKQIDNNGEILDSALLASFMAYSPSFTGGVNVAAGVFGGGDIDDVVTGAGAGGGPHVRVFTITGGQATQLAGPLGSFLAYDPAFTGGVSVAAGNVAGQPGDELITGAGPSGGPNVEVFRADGSLLANFLAYDPAFRGGVSVATGDFNGDGHADLVIGPGSGGGPEVKVIDGTKLGQLAAGAEILGTALLADFLPYDAHFTGGVQVGAADLNGDGRVDLITGAGPSGGPHVQVFNGDSSLALDSFFASSPGFTGGVFVGGR
jgi:hypothetical protein